MKIEELTDFSTTNLGRYQRALAPVVAVHCPLLKESDLRNIVDSESTKLFLAIDEDGVFGMLSLVLFRIPTGRKAWVEDVVVDEKARGRGVGKLLTEHAIQVAREHGAHSVDLTSRPSREAANALYQRVGFQQTRDQCLSFPGILGGLPGTTLLFLFVIARSTATWQSSRSDTPRPFPSPPLSMRGA